MRLWGFFFYISQDLTRSHRYAVRMPRAYIYIYIYMPGIYIPGTYFVCLGQRCALILRRQGGRLERGARYSSLLQAAFYVVFVLLGMMLREFGFVEFQRLVRRRQYGSRLLCWCRPCRDLRRVWPSETLTRTFSFVYVARRCLHETSLASRKERSHRIERVRVGGEVARGDLQGAEAGGRKGRVVGCLMRVLRDVEVSVAWYNWCC